MAVLRQGAAIRDRIRQQNEDPSKNLHVAVLSELINALIASQATEL